MLTTALLILSPPLIGIAMSRIHDRINSFHVIVSFSTIVHTKLRSTPRSARSNIVRVTECLASHSTLDLRSRGQNPRHYTENGHFIVFMALQRHFDIVSQFNLQFSRIEINSLQVPTEIVHQVDGGITTHKVPNFTQTTLGMFGINELAFPVL